MVGKVYLLAYPCPAPISLNLLGKQGIKDLYRAGIEVAFMYKRKS